MQLRAIARQAAGRLVAGGFILNPRTPGMRKEGSPFPSERGVILAKDVWMPGIGLGLVIDAATQEGNAPRER